MDNALIVVDVQNDFCPGGVLAVPGGDTIIPLINTLLRRFPVSILTQDWHPRGHCSFASTFGLPPFSPDTITASGGILWPDHCVAGTRGADFHPALESWRGRFILRKGVRPELDSYSAFFENDGKTSTGLAGLLHSLNISRIVVCGLATDYCVKATALDGRKAGFEVTVAEDVIRGIDANPGDIERAIEAMVAAGCRVTTSATLLRGD
ncbi:MAG: bifunctional nicotinamidase/pyrazinamidase [Rectinema sp.]|nr:bifunctional nicotinamidase/pyrazinamidase [Rectinema sp.]